MTVKKGSAGAKVVPAKADKNANIAPASDFEASGAVIEEGATSGVDMSHPSIDDNPRRDTTEDMNRIDPNMPSGLQAPEETVEEALKGGE